MAVYTSISEAEADAIARAHHLGAALGVDPIAAGSVNTNCFLRTAAGNYFMRVYEEQATDGVAYEWALLSHLSDRGLPVPRRVSGTEPGQVRVSGKPTAVFELVGGDETCQANVTEARAFAIGHELGRCHVAASDFQLRKASRFNLAWLGGQLREIAHRERPELRDVVNLLDTSLREASAAPTHASGVIHGDLFRDNVRWEGDRVVGLLDWESASDGCLTFDIMVTLLAWCFGDTLDWTLARALVKGYQTQRSIGDAEALSMRAWGIAAATRFSITRILSYHLREDAIGERVIKDYRRFIQRLELLRAMSPEDVARRLLGPDSLRPPSR